MHPETVWGKTGSFPHYSFYSMAQNLPCSSGILETGGPTRHMVTKHHPGWALLSYCLRIITNAFLLIAGAVGEQNQIKIGKELPKYFIT